MVEWAHRFDCPIHLHAADAEWVMRPDAAIRHWEGDVLELGHGLTLVRGGGHFPGGAMLHRAEGAGELLTGDIIQVIPDRSHVGFMWSYPNLVPLPEAEVQAIAAAVEPFEFATIYGAWWDRIIPSGAKDVVMRSAERYGRALRGGAQLDSSSSNVMPCRRRRSISASPIATAVVTWPAVGGRSSVARQSADSASILAVSP